MNKCPSCFSTLKYSYSFDGSLFYDCHECGKQSEDKDMKLFEVHPGEDDWFTTDELEKEIERLKDETGWEYVQHVQKCRDVLAKLKVRPSLLVSNRSEYLVIGGIRYYIARSS